MKNFTRRIAVIVGAVAVSIGLIGATAAPVHADGGSKSFRDSSWPH